MLRAAVMVEVRRSSRSDELGEVGTGSRRGGVGQLDWFEHEEGPSGTHLFVRAGHDLSDPAVHLGADDGLHLHRLEHDQRIARGDDVAGLHRHGHDDARCWGADGAAVVTRDAVGDAVDLDEVGAGLLGREHAVRARPDGQAAPVAGRLRDFHVDASTPSTSTR